MKNTVSKELYQDIMYSEFKDLGIFSNAYFRAVIANMNFSEPIVAMYGDFKGLHGLNLKIGEEEVDVCLHNALQSILETLPKETIAGRVGGDEFAFVIPVSSLAKLPNEYIKEISENLKLINPEDRILEVDMCSSSSTSKSVSLHELFNEAICSVEEIKLKRDPESNFEDPFDQLNILLQNNIDGIIKTFRLSNQISSEDAHKFLSIIAKQVIKLLNHDPNIISCSLNKSSLLANPNTTMPPTVLSKIHEFLTTSEVSSKDYDISDDSLEDLLSSLVIDYDSNLFNDLYYKNFFLPSVAKSGNKYSILYYDTSGLKISNTTLGHLETNKELSKAYTTIADSLENALDTKFTTDLLDFDEDKPFIFKLRGAHVAAFIPESFGDISNKDLFSFMEDVQSTITPNSGLSFVPCYSFTPTSDIEETVATLSANCYHSKDIHKTKKLKGIAGKDVFEKFLEVPTQYFVENIPDCLEPENRTKFFHLISSCLAKSITEHNKEIDESKNSRNRK